MELSIYRWTSHRNLYLFGSNFKGDSPPFIEFIVEFPSYKPPLIVDFPITFPIFFHYKLTLNPISSHSLRYSPIFSHKFPCVSKMFPDFPIDLPRFSHHSHILPNFPQNPWLVVSTYPSEKWWSSSVGIMTFPILMESHNPFMFQTTNQILYPLVN